MSVPTLESAQKLSAGRFPSPGSSRDPEKPSVTVGLDLIRTWWGGYRISLIGVNQTRLLLNKMDFMWTVNLHPFLLCITLEIYLALF